MSFVAILLVSDKCPNCQRLLRSREFKYVWEMINNYTCFAVMDIERLREFCPEVIHKVSDVKISYDSGYLKILETLQEPALLYKTKRGEWKVYPLDFMSEDELRVKASIVRNLLKLLVVENPNICKSVRGRRSRKRGSEE